MADLRTALLGALPADRVITDIDLLVSYQQDEADLVGFGLPAAVVRPRTTAEVQAAVRVAASLGVPVVPQGARTGLAGGANSIPGCLVISMTAMDQILTVDPINRFAVVQPGVVIARLAERVRTEGLRYPPDPGSWESSTIGGNVATNAGGMCCVNYGVTAEYVWGLEVVLADGEVLRTGRRTPKGVAGLDLTRLFVGSEGTLGVITEITVALRPMAEPSLTLAAVFPTIASAGQAVTDIVSAGATPSLLELIDHVHLRAIEAYRPMGLNISAQALLLAAVDTGERAPRDLAVLADLCRAAGAAEVYQAEDEQQAADLLRARRSCHPAMEKLAAQAFPSGQGGLIIDDVAVPRSQLTRLIDGVAAIAARHAMTVGLVGHAGDGNLHPTIVVDRGDPDSIARARACFDDIMRLGLALGGTISGEHGIGLLKRDWLAAEIGPVGMRVHHAIKLALDPHGLFNPGKVL